MAQRKKAACDVALNDKIFKNIKHEGRKRKYKRKIKMLKGKVQHLQEALQREQNTYNLLWDACDARGLICSICLEDIVQQSALPCCSNSMCKICEDQVAEKHQRCPFCRAPMTPSQSVLDRQREQQQQQQQQQQPLDDYFRAIGFGQTPDADVGSGDSYRQHQHSAMAALQGFLAQQLALSMPSGAACPDEDLSDDDYNGYGSEDEGAEDGYEGMEQPHWDGTDNTVLYAAAAEAVAAARAGPSGNCGLCDDRFLLASLAGTEELPGILVCRHCWRNMPGLSDTPFPAGRTAAPAAERLAMGRSADNASPPPPAAAAAAAADADARQAQPIRAAALAVPTAGTHLVAGSSKPSKHKDKHKRKHNAHAVPRSAAAKDIGGSSFTSSHHKKRQRHADAHNVPNHTRKKQQDQQQLQEGSMPLKKKVKKAVAAGASTAEPTKKVAVRGCGVAAPIGSHSSKRSKNKQKSLPGHKGLQISGQST